MPRSLITTNSFNSVNPNARATLTLPVGNLVYHEWLLTYTTATVGGANRTNMEAEITNIRILIDGVVQREHSAAELFKLNEVNGIAFADGFLPIFFSEPWRRTVESEEALAWGTADIPDLVLEVDIGAATTPTLSARLVVDRNARGLGPIKKIRRHTIGVTATGIRNVTTLPTQDAYYRLHAFSTDIDDIKVIVDQDEVWNLTDAQARQLFAEQGLAVPAALTSVIFDHTQRSSDALPMNVPDGAGGVTRVSEFRLDYNMNAATTFTLLTETVGPRD